MALAANKRLPNCSVFGVCFLSKIPKPGVSTMTHSKRSFLLCHFTGLLNVGHVHGHDRQL